MARKKAEEYFKDAPQVIGGHLPAQKVSVKVLPLDKLMSLKDALNWFYTEAMNQNIDPEWVEAG